MSSFHASLPPSPLPQERPQYTALLVLDAGSWQELGRAEFLAKGAVTGTFHGLFAPPGTTTVRY